jgi:hypothetical protein
MAMIAERGNRWLPERVAAPSVMIGAEPDPKVKFRLLGFDPSA